MKTFKVILIEPNNLSVFNPNLPEFDREIEQFVKVETVNQETFIPIVCNFLQNKDEDYMNDTILCHETYNKKIYELCYVDNVSNGINSRGDNILASQLCYVHKKIDGKVALLGSKVNLETGLPECIDVDISVLKKILLKKYFHKGIYVHHSGNMIDFIYHNNNFNVLNDENKKEGLQPHLQDIFLLIKNGLHYEYSIFKYNLVIIVPQEYKNEPCNKIISMLVYDDNKKLEAKGNFIILNKVAENEYVDISIKELKQMVYLYKNKNLTVQDVSNETQAILNKETKIEKVKNRYMVLYNKFKEYRKDNKISEMLNNFNEYVKNNYSIIEYKSIFNEYIITLNKQNKDNLPQEITNNLPQEITNNLIR